MGNTGGSCIDSGRTCRRRRANGRSRGGFRGERGPPGPAGIDHPRRTIATGWRWGGWRIIGNRTCSLAMRDDSGQGRPRTRVENLVAEMLFVESP
jgi:hypothetical protein